MTGLAYPDISPIIFSIGPLAIRWYSMAYLFGIIAAWFLIAKDIKKYNLGLSKANLEDIVCIKREKDGTTFINKPMNNERVKMFLQNELGLDDLFLDGII